MTSKALSDPYFDINLSSVYNLSIQLSQDGFCLIIRDLSRNKLVYFQDYDIPELPDGFEDVYLCQYLFDFLSENELFQETYKQIDILYHSPHASNVPLAVFDKEKSDELFRTNFPGINHVDLFTNRYRNTDAALIYAVPDCVNRILSGHFSHYKFTHPGIVLVDLAMKENKQKNEAQFYAYVAF